MWRSYFTVAIRALGKNRTFTFINIFGLALGLAAGLIILLYVRYETGYDRWLPGSERAFQLQTWFRATDDGSPEMKLQGSNIRSRTALVKDFPQIENSVFLIRGGAVVMQDRQMSLPMDLYFVDGNLFDVLQFPFTRGDPRTALARPNSLVMTESESIRRFGTTDSIGRELTLITRAGQQEYVVTGVIADPQSNTHIRPSIVARFDPAIYFKEFMPILTNWVGQSGWTYVKLRPGADAEEINRQLPAWEKRNIPDETTGGVTTNPGDVQDWKLVNIADVHLGEAQDGALTPGNDRSQILTFAIVALLTLGMAVANFTNLATARASQRAREVAMRKVLGASRGQLIAQFLGESILVAAIATTLALAMVELALPYFNEILGTGITLSYLGDNGLLLPSVILAIAVGVAGGLYPAFCLSSFQPTQVLKANKSVAEPEGSGRLRNLLVIAQFAVSIGLIICTAVIYAQTLYARTSNTGYDREGLLQINRLGARQAEPIAERIKEEIRKVRGVESAALTSIRIDPPNYSEISVQLPGDPKLIQIGYYGIDTDYIDTMGMTLLAGRKFSPAIARDDATTPYPVVPEAEEAIVKRGVNVVMSESAIHRLGFRTPEQAVGKEILTEMSYPGFGLVPTTIVGVVKDVRYRSVRDPIQPIMYFYARTFHSALMVRYRDVPADQVMADLRRVWEKLVPGVPFSADFVDDRIRDLYRAEEARGQIFGIFALLAVIIGCLGLFGLAAFTAERRTKEIGIRKVLGARTWDIVKLLAWQFSKPVIIANSIAWPVAWWVMRDWLGGFEYHVALGPGPFLSAGLLALVIAIATIAAHAMNVARANPVNALRYE